jgi:hypothetical protein
MALIMEWGSKVVLLRQSADSSRHIFPGLGNLEGIRRWCRDRLRDASLTNLPGRTIPSSRPEAVSPPAKTCGGTLSQGSAGRSGEASVGNSGGGQ